MSNIYIQEPPTIGKVLLKTSCGDVDIELWSKETPKTCRNFVQLCMEGYYDGTIFHRVVPEFIVQGGDPTGTGEGGESIYGKPFKDEIHSRLRFVRRGLVAMANSGPNDNGSQFFFTLGQAPELNKKHTIFGKLAGNTVYNMLKLAEVECEGERPVHPHKILKTEILANPFDDIIPREIKKKDTEKESKQKKSRSKATKNFSLLSFGEEAEEDEEQTNNVTMELKGKSKSSHDLTNDPRLSSVPAVVAEEVTSSKKERKHSSSDDESDSDNNSPRERIRKKLKKETSEKVPDDERDIKPTTRSDELRKEVIQLKRELMEAKKRKEQREKNSSSPEDKSEQQPKEVTAVEEFKKQKQKYKDLKKKQPKTGTAREQQTLALLAKFQSKLHAAQSQGDEKEDKEEAKDADLQWLSHKLEFETKDKKVIDANVAEVDRYEIFDPRNPLTKRRREASKQKAKDKI